MNTITPEYAALNRQMHDEIADYGAKGAKWAEHVEKVAKLLNTTSILDYGCGKGGLAKELSALPIREYDPAISGKDRVPAAADLVVCTDVLEHVEPENMKAVLMDLSALTNKMLFLSVACGPAAKTLPDGRNAHLSQHGAPWWIDQINRRFVIVQLQLLPGPTVFIIARSLDEDRKLMQQQDAAT